ncbi:MAG: OmpH family outer membrane protein [Gammaproteobacteria bacterium]|nr:OmpH family outer membrane protein [Gammaproteobacteria bacterium]
MKKLLITLALLGGLSLALNASADIKIGVLDLQAVLQQSPQVQSADVKFRKEFSPREQKIKAQADALQTEVDQLNRNAAVMSAVEQGKTKDKIAKDQDNLQQAQAQFQQDVQTAQGKAMQQILTQIKTVVATLAAQNGYDLVVQKSSVVYSKDEYDVTALVIKQLKK